LKIVFMGTSSFAVPSLKSLIESPYQVVGIISQPDRPKGRGKKLSPPPVKKIAESHNLPVFQPKSIKDIAAVDQVKCWEPDLIIVVSYGQIIPSGILDYPLYGCINVHASLLPKYRGAAPIQRALMAGEKATGITTMFMDEGLDTGDIIMQRPVSIDNMVNHGELETELAEIGAQLLMDTIEALNKKNITRKKQDNQRATYAHMLTREEEGIDWREPAVAVHNKIRAMSPVPGAYFYADGMRVKVYKSRVYEEKGNGVISQVVDYTDDGFIVQTADGLVEILEVQKEGKKRMLSRDFLKGFNLKPGTLLGIQGG